MLGCVDQHLLEHRASLSSAGLVQCGKASKESCAWLFLAAVTGTCLGAPHALSPATRRRCSLCFLKNREWAFVIYCADQGTEVTIASQPGEFCEWTHVVGTFDGTVMRLYVNGRLEAQAELYKEVRDRVQ
jgi:hypothetical protein